MSEPLSDSALDQLFRTARTYNGYLDMPVSDAQLRAIWDLMKFGPTSANSLPARIVWCVSDDAKEKLAALSMPANAEKILKAPVTAIIAMDNEFYEHLPELFPHTDARSWFAGNAPHAATTAFRNSSLQGGYFIMAARALGLDTGPMSGFNNDAVDAGHARSIGEKAIKGMLDPEHRIEAVSYTHRILVGCGPGSFAGVRIGVAAARALGLAWGVPVRGFSTPALVAAAAAAPIAAAGGALVVMEGGHGQWFVQPFGAELTPRGPVQSLLPDAAIASGEALIVGNRAEAFVARRGFGEALAMLPDARALPALPADALFDDPRPIYGRCGPQCGDARHGCGVRPRLWRGVDRGAVADAVRAAFGAHLSGVGRGARVRLLCRADRRARKRIAAARR